MLSDRALVALPARARQLAEPALLAGEPWMLGRSTVEVLVAGLTMLNV